MIIRSSLVRAGVLLFAVLAACDRAPLDSAARPPETGAPSEPVALARMQCTATVATGAIACTAPAPGTGPADGLVVGGPNGTYVFLAASGHTYTPADSLFTIDVTVQNLMYQALGTTNGTTADPDGVRIFFSTEPAAPVELVNELRGMITGPDQAYFQYAGLLETNATSSASEWQFRVPPAVTSFQFGVYVSAAVQYPDGVVQVTPAADSILSGQTVDLASQVVNAYGDALADQSVTWGTSDAGVATVDAAGLVTGVGVGTATITATQGTRSGSATIAVCPNLALGGVYTADMPAGSSLCLGAGEYVVMPANTSEAASVSLSLTASGIVPVSGAPTPALLPGGRALRSAPRLVPDDAWESRLRRMERTTLPRGLPSGPRAEPRGPRMAITPGVPAVGALMTLNVETDNACSTFDNRTGQVVAVGTRVIIMADTMNPAGGLSAAQYAAIADTFDTIVWPTITGTFGVPADIDGNSRVIAFYTRAVNELTPPASSSFVGGFVFSRDLYPTASCATSNVGEMFYMLAADPAGTVNGNVRSTSFIMSKTMGTLAHEFEHLINASRRMHVNTPWNGDFEETWLDEGLAHISEELIFYAASGLSAGTNLDVGDVAAEQDYFFSYAESNFGRMRQWLLSPHASGAFQDDDDLATRGAAWAFLRYVSDRDPGTDAALFGAMVNTGETGLANVETAIGTDPLPWYRDFVAAMYGDDAGIGTVAPYTQPSWDFRSIYAALDYDPGPGCSCIYPLTPRNPSNGVSDGFTLSSGGGAAFARVGVGAGAFAGVTVLSGGVAPPATVRMTIIRRE